MANKAEKFPLKDVSVISSVLPLESNLSDFPTPINLVVMKK